jgi:hypothetical protein
LLLKIDNSKIAEFCPQANSIRPVVLQDKKYPEYIGVVGASTMISRNAKCFIVCTRHQLSLTAGAEGKLSNYSSPLFISHTNSGQLRSIPVESCLFATDPVIQELHDILIFRAVDEYIDSLEERPWFYPLNELPVGNRLGSFFIGCPSASLEISYDPLDVLFKTVLYACDHEVAAVSQEKHLDKYSYALEKAISLDGFSGGAVFSAHETPSGPKVFLSGIITRGGNGSIYAIDANYVANAIDHAAHS